MTTVFYSSQSFNSKTGNIPQQWIGATREESKATCTGCPLLDNGCYARRARIAWGHSNVIRSVKDKSIEAALRGSIRSARYIRFGTIGDPSAIDPAVYDEHMRLARAYELGVLSYTYFWRTRGSWLRGKALASCDTVCMMSITPSRQAGGLLCTCLNPIRSFRPKTARLTMVQRSSCVRLNAQIARSPAMIAAYVTRPGKL